MKKIVATVIICFSLLVISLFTVALFIDYNAAYQNFLSNIQLTTEPNNISKITIKKFPLPYLVIDNIKQEGRMEIDDIEVHFSLWSLIKFKPKISSLKASTVKINVASCDFNLSNHDILIANLISKGAIDMDVDIAKLTLFAANNQQILSLNDIALKRAGDSTSIFQGNINDWGKFTGTFTAEGNLVNLAAKFINEHYNLQLFESYKDCKLSTGKVEWQIKSLSKLLANEFPEAKLLFGKINRDEIMEVKFDILPTIDLLQLQNLIISSNSVSGRGNIDVSRARQSDNRVNLHFSKIDMKSLVNYSNNSQEIKTLSNSILADKLIKADILIETIYISDQYCLNNVRISSSLEHNILSIKQFSGQIQSGGEFKLAGNLSQNSFRSIFVGKIDLQHGNLNAILSAIGYDNLTVGSGVPFVFSADLRFTLMDLYLQNILLKTDSTKITGSIASKSIGSQPRINLLHNMSTIDFSSSDYPLIASLAEFVNNLTVNMEDKEYLNKFMPITAIPYWGNFDLTFNNLKYKGADFGQVNIVINISPGKIAVNSLKINTGTGY